MKIEDQVPTKGSIMYQLLELNTAFTKLKYVIMKEFKKIFKRKV